METPELWTAALPSQLAVSGRQPSASSVMLVHDLRVTSGVTPGRAIALAAYATTAAAAAAAATIPQDTPAIPLVSVLTYCTLSAASLTAAFASAGRQIWNQVALGKVLEDVPFLESVRLRLCAALICASAAALVFWFRWDLITTDFQDQLKFHEHFGIFLVAGSAFSAGIGIPIIFASLVSSLKSWTALVNPGRLLLLLVLSVFYSMVLHMAALLSLPVILLSAPVAIVMFGVTLMVLRAGIPRTRKDESDVEAPRPASEYSRCWAISIGLLLSLMTLVKTAVVFLVFLFDVQLVKRQFETSRTVCEDVAPELRRDTEGASANMGKSLDTQLQNFGVESAILSKFLDSFGNVLAAAMDWRVDVSDELSLKCVGLRRLGSAFVVWAGVATVSMICSIDILSIIEAGSDIASNRMGADESMSLPKYLYGLGRLAALEMMALLLVQWGVAIASSHAKDAAGIFIPCRGWLVDTTLHSSWDDCRNDLHPVVEVVADIALLSAVVCAIVVLLAINAGWLYGLPHARWLVSDFFGKYLKLADFVQEIHADDNTVIISFQPRALDLRTDWLTGTVLDVSPDGQGHNRGVQIGWQIIQVRGQHYSQKLLEACMEGTEMFEVTFRKKAMSEEPDRGGCRQDSKASFRVAMMPTSQVARSLTSRMLQPFVGLGVTFGLWTGYASRIYSIELRQEWYEANGSPGGTVLVSWGSIYRATSRTISVGWYALPGGIALAKCAEYLNEYVIFAWGQDGGKPIARYFYDADKQLVHILNWATMAIQTGVLVAIDLRLLDGKQSRQLMVLGACVGLVLVMVCLRVFFTLLAQTFNFGFNHALLSKYHALLESGALRAIAGEGSIVDRSIDPELVKLALQEFDAATCASHQQQVFQAASELLELQWARDGILMDDQKAELIAFSKRGSTHKRWMQRLVQPDSVSETPLGQSALQLVLLLREVADAEVVCALAPQEVNALASREIRAAVNPRVGWMAGWARHRAEILAIDEAKQRTTGKQIPSEEPQICVRVSYAVCSVGCASAVAESLANHRQIGTTATRSVTIRVQGALEARPDLDGILGPWRSYATKPDQHSVVFDDDTEPLDPSSFRELCPKTNSPLPPLNGSAKERALHAACEPANSIVGSAPSAINDDFDDASRAEGPEFPDDEVAPRNRGMLTALHWVLSGRPERSEMPASVGESLAELNTSVQADTGRSTRHGTTDFGSGCFLCNLIFENASACCSCGEDRATIFPIGDESSLIRRSWCTRALDNEWRPGHACVFDRLQDMSCVSDVTVEEDVIEEGLHFIAHVEYEGPDFPDDEVAPRNRGMLTALHWAVGGRLEGRKIPSPSLATPTRVFTGPMVHENGLGGSISESQAGDHAGRRKSDIVAWHETVIQMIQDNPHYGPTLDIYSKPEPSSAEAVLESLQAEEFEPKSEDKHIQMLEEALFTARCLGLSADSVAAAEAQLARALEADAQKLNKQKQGEARRRSLQQLQLSVQSGIADADAIRSAIGEARSVGISVESLPNELHAVSETCNSEEQVAATERHPFAVQ